MFDITADDIRRLNDVDLRELVGRLCEAELSSRGLSPAAVTWGGSQTAADGGLDVRVSLPDGMVVDGFVPRAQTGFQVKKPDMPRKAIISEMRPDGTLRPVIEELAQRSGAYVIVSSTGSTADVRLEQRRAAMRETLCGTASASQLETDFYDRNRMATWVRCHPGLVAWAREKAGRAISGWRSYGPWCGVEDEYLVDDKLRVDLGKSGESVRSVMEAMDTIRDELAAPRTSIRLVGLSGVGKTRFVQALFDARIGSRPLAPSLAVYTNLSDDPNPQPTALLSDLIANRKHAVLIVDNCPPELHGRLTELCNVQDSQVSLLTVEYDIQDDQPEGTHVIRLETSSTDLIARLVRLRFEHLSAVDAGTIAEASGGNARIAIALADTVGKTESIGGLSNKALFERLFRQRQDSSDSLLRAAQACALVYSFDGEKRSGIHAELPRLAALAGQPVDETYRHVSELLRRDLLQKRGVWRAVLPHAIANRLAARALDDIPFDLIDEQILSAGAERLAQSFSRRLSFLHEHPTAIAIVRNWLQPDGLVGDVTDLNHIGRAMFENVAPVLPDATLAAFERASAGTPPPSEPYWPRRVNLLRSLAYDAELFARSASLLATTAAQRRDTSIQKRASDAFLSLFTVRLSGTRATIAQRLSVIETLLHSTSDLERSLGVRALDKTLRTMYFNSFDRFTFGSRSRDYGLHPSTGREIAEWYRTVLTFLERMVSTHVDMRQELHTVLASNFRGLWNLGHVHEELETLSRKIASDGLWREGWAACWQTLRFDKKAMGGDVASRLAELESSLRPVTLVDKIRAIVLNKAGVEIEAEDGAASAVDRITSAASKLGEALVRDDSAFAEILPEVLQEMRWTFSLGRGIAKAAPDRRVTWSRLVEGLERIAPERRRVDALTGFLAAVWEDDRRLGNELFDAALDEPALRPLFPYIQAAVTLDESGAKRLQKALQEEMAPIASYGCLQFGRVCEALPGDILRDLLLQIAARAGGFSVALNLLFMRLFLDGGCEGNADPGLIDAARSLLRQATFGANDVGLDMAYAQVAKTALTASNALPVASEMMNRLGRAVAQGHSSWSDYDELLRTMFRLHPIAVMDTLFRDAGAMPDHTDLVDRSGQRANPAEAMSREALIEWCGEDAARRSVCAAGIVTFAKSAEGGTGMAWSEHATALLKHSPDPERVLTAFVERMRPTSWSGSRAAIMEANAQLLDKLETVIPSSALPFVKRAKVQLAIAIAAEMQRETEEDRVRNERFE